MKLRSSIPYYFVVTLSVYVAPDIQHPDYMVCDNAQRFFVCRITVQPDGDMIMSIGTS